MTWQRVESGTEATLEALWGRGPEEVYAAGAAGTILKSVDRGRTWHALDSGRATTRFYALCGSGDGEVYAAGDGKATILRSADGGRHFTRCPTRCRFTTDSIYDLWTTGDGDVFAGGAFGGGRGGALLRSADRGKTWCEALTGLTGGVVAVWGRGQREVYALTSEDLFHSDDGRTFAPVPLDRSGIATRPMYLMDLWGDAAGDAVIVVSNLNDLHERTSPGVWSRRRTRNPGGISATRIGGRAKDDLHVLAELGGVFHSTDGGRSWAEVEMPVRAVFRAIWCSDDGLTLLAGTGGTIVRRDG